VLVAGTHTNITWTATDNVAVTTVDLELSRNGAAGPFESIATGIANTGTFDWLVTLPTTSQALIRVTAHDAAGHATQDVSNAVFSIAGRSLTVNVLPAGRGHGGQVAGSGQLRERRQRPAHGERRRGVELLRLERRGDGLDQPRRRGHGRRQDVTATFIDVGSPTASVTAPNGGEVLVAGTHTDITWTAADNAAVTTVDLELSRNGAAGPYESIATGIANTGTFDWLVTLPTTSQALIRVTAHDAAGHATQDVSNAVFSIAGRSLTVNVSPAGRGHGGQVPGSGQLRERRQRPAHGEPRHGVELLRLERRGDGLHQPRRRGHGRRPDGDGHVRRRRLADGDAEHSQRW
jgi:hypothetical protein